MTCKNAALEMFKNSSNYFTELTSPCCLEMCSWSVRVLQTKPKARSLKNKNTDYTKKKNKNCGGGSTTKM